MKNYFVFKINSFGCCFLSILFINTLNLHSQNINLNKHEYKLGDTVKIKITKSAVGDSVNKIIDFSKLENIIFSLDTNKFEKYADVEILRINDDTILKENKVTINSLSELEIELSIFSLGAFRLVGNKNDSTLILVNDLDSLNLQSDIKDILPIFESEEIDWSWLKIVLPILVLLLLMYFIYRNRKKLFKKKQKTEIVIERPQYEITLEQLNKLKSDKQWTIENVKEFQTELIDILRKYISHYFIKDAFNLTSEELIKSSSKKLSDSSLITILEELFSLSDMVKFAKAKPESTVFEEAVDKAISFVNKTKPEKTL